MVKNAEVRKMISQNLRYFFYLHEDKRQGEEGEGLSGPRGRSGRSCRFIFGERLVVLRQERGVVGAPAGEIHFFENVKS